MPFFPVDDEAAFNSKIRAAGNAAVGLWTRAGSYCMKQASNGVLERHELEGMGKPAEARKLVEVGLWHAHGHTCDRCTQPPKGGWIFHDWHDWGPLKSREQIKSRREADRERQRRRRGHGERHAVTPGVTPPVSHAVGPRSPSPDPSVVQSVSQSQVATRAIDGLTDDDLEHIRKRLNATRSHAVAVAREVLARAQATVANPRRYVLAAIDAEPERYRPTRGPIAVTDECALHAGQPADNCGGCAADARAVDR